MNIVKRNGEEVAFDRSKIVIAVSKANESVPATERILETDIEAIAAQVECVASASRHPMSVEEIQDMVENCLIETGRASLAKNYITYRFQHELARRKDSTDDEILSLLDGKNEDANQENANKNPTVLSVQRDYMAGMVSKAICHRYIYPKDIMDAHDEGIIHVHDMDYSAARLFNCQLINLEDMLQNGTVISGTMIERPMSFLTACNITTQIIAQVASNQFGGQSINIAHLAPFVDVSRQKIQRQVEDEYREAGISASAEQTSVVVAKRLLNEIQAAVQELQYQVLTLMTTNGQAPFVTMFMYLGDAKSDQEREDLAMVCAEILKQRIIGVKNERGEYYTVAFPKLIYVLEEQNIHDDSKYFWLTKLAAKCSARRMVPDYISEKVMKALKVDSHGEGHCFSPMGCRSMLSVWEDENGKAKFWGRFNQGVCTLNLPYVGLLAREESINESNGELPFARTAVECFWPLLEEKAELCHRALKIRHERLEGTPSDFSPIHFQHGAVARLKPGETIDKLLHGGYSTISLGYIGLSETVLALIGKKLTDPEGRELGIKIMEKLNEFTNKWKQEEDVGYSPYGTPEESLTYKSAKALQRRFGVIPGITDRDYVVNSYHVPPFQPIDAFSKLSAEAPFQALSTGGSVAYVEVPNLEDNLDSVIAIMRHMYNTICYSEINTRQDFCACGFRGEIPIVRDESGKLVFKCPECGTTDKHKMSITRRVCGYLSSGNDFNQGRMADIKARVLHVD